MIETGGAGYSEEQFKAHSSAIIAAFERALDALVAARGEEGARLAPVLEGAFRRIEELAGLIEAHPSRRAEAVRERLGQQVLRLVETETALSPERLHQEAVLLATRADVEEELQRLAAHVAAGRALLAEPGAVGRRLDFLSQEFNREANTICSKANDIEVTGHRAGAQGGDRSGARAGAEHRMTERALLGAVSWCVPDWKVACKSAIGSAIGGLQRGSRPADAKG